jgi:hypothetical protein
LLLEAFLLYLPVLGGLIVRHFHLIDDEGDTDEGLGIGIFQDYYEQNQLRSYSSSDVAWISSIESFMLFFWVCLACAFLKT